MKPEWKLIGLDTFAEEEYPVGAFPTQKAVLRAAAKKLRQIEEMQPSDSFGGQADDGIQDRLFIKRPDGTRYRFIPRDLINEL